MAASSVFRSCLMKFTRDPNKWETIQHTALHSSQRLIEKFAGDYQDTEPDWVRTGLIIPLVIMSYCHNLVFLVFKPNFFW